MDFKTKISPLSNHNFILITINKLPVSLKDKFQVRTEKSK